MAAAAAATREAASAAASAVDDFVAVVLADGDVAGAPNLATGRRLRLVGVVDS